MNSINQVSSLNNEGVQLLVSGHTGKAITCFKSALAFLKIDAAPQHAQGIKEEDSFSSWLTSSLHQGVICESPSIPDFQVMQGYVYDHGIFISCDTNQEARSDFLLVSLYSAVVLFNLALAYHYEGKLGCEKSLKKASTFYNMCVELVSRTTVNIPEDKTATLITTLARNNKAQIHYEQCEYATSAYCLTEIAKIMDVTHDIGSALNPQAVEGLLLNIMLLSRPTAAHAA